MSAVTGWQPIGSEPRDGTDFVGGWFFQGRFVADLCKHYARSGEASKIIQARYRHRLDPTHWLPLPAAPVTA